MPLSVPISISVARLQSTILLLNIFSVKFVSACLVTCMRQYFTTGTCRKVYEIKLWITFKFFCRPSKLSRRPLISQYAATLWDCKPNSNDTNLTWLSMTADIVSVAKSICFVPLHYGNVHGTSILFAVFVQQLVARLIPRKRKYIRVNRFDSVRTKVYTYSGVICAQHNSLKI